MRTFMHALACSFALGLLGLVEANGMIYIPLWFYAVYAAVWTVGCITFFEPPVRVGALIVHTVFLISLLVLHLVPWTPRKPFLQDLRRVQVGMKEQQVEAIMGKYIGGTGWPAYASPTVEDGELELVGARVYRHSNHGNYNADWGIVRFENGRVVKTEFSPD